MQTCRHADMHTCRHAAMQMPPACIAACIAGRNHRRKQITPYYNTQTQHLHQERPYHVDRTTSRPLCEVKRRRARLVLRWGTTWEALVLFLFLLTPSLFYHHSRHYHTLFCCLLLLLPLPLPLPLPFLQNKRTATVLLHALLLRAPLPACLSLRHVLPSFRIHTHIGHHTPNTITTASCMQQQTLQQQTPAGRTQQTTGVMVCGSSRGVLRLKGSWCYLCSSSWCYLCSSACHGNRVSGMQQSRAEEPRRDCAAHRVASCG